MLKIQFSVPSGVSLSMSLLRAQFLFLLHKHRPSWTDTTRRTLKEGEWERGREWERAKEGGVELNMVPRVSAPPAGFAAPWAETSDPTTLQSALGNPRAQAPPAQSVCVHCLFTSARKHSEWSHSHHGQQRSPLITPPWIISELDSGMRIKENKKCEQQCLSASAVNVYVCVCVVRGSWTGNMPPDCRWSDDPRWSGGAALLFHYQRGSRSAEALSLSISLNETMPLL